MSQGSSAAASGVVAAADTHLAFLLQSSMFQRDLLLLCWTVVMEEEVARQAVCLCETDDRHEVMRAFYCSALARVTLTTASLSTQIASPTSRSVEQSSPQLRALPAVAVADVRGESIRHGVSFASPLEQLATAVEGADTRSDTASEVAPPCIKKSTEKDVLMQKLRDIEHALSKLARPSFPSAQPSRSSCTATEADKSADDSSSSVPPRVSLDTCLSLLDRLVTSHQTLSELGPTSQKQRQRHPYDDGNDWDATTHLSDRPFLAATSRQQHVLSILTLLRDALHSVQDAYAYATHNTASSSLPVSLDVLLQLPPDTLPLLMFTPGGPSHWRRLVTSTSLYTLWSALTDSVELFACVQRPVVDTLWAAVMWMQASYMALSFASLMVNDAPDERTPVTPSAAKRSSPPSASHRSKADDSFALPPKTLFDARLRTSALLPRQAGSPRRPSTLQPSPSTVSRIVRRSSPAWLRPKSHSPLAVDAHSNEKKEEERWAYRDFPVRRAYTAPTVYDELFPLPTAVSAFTDPKQGDSLHAFSTVRQAPSPANGGVSGVVESPWREKEKESAWRLTPAVDFYTGPSRRPQRL